MNFFNFLKEIIFNVDLEFYTQWKYLSKKKIE